VSKARPSSRPLVTATTTSRPITRNTARCVPLQVRIGRPVRLGQASSPVRLCHRPLGRHWLDRRMGGQPFQPLLVIGVQTPFVVVDACPERSDRNTLTVMCCAFKRVNALFIIYRSRPPDGRGHWGNRPRPEQTHLSPNSTIGNEVVNVTSISGTPALPPTLTSAPPPALVSFRALGFLSPLPKRRPDCSIRCAQQAHPLRNCCQKPLRKLMQPKPRTACPNIWTSKSQYPRSLVPGAFDSLRKPRFTRPCASDALLVQCCCRNCRGDYAMTAACTERVVEQSQN
jgi:hypothetical protein